MVDLFDLPPPSNNYSFLQECVLCLIAYALLFFQCSVTCGQGKTMREVQCVNYSEQEMNSNECDLDDRPRAEQDCAMSQCPSRSSESRPFPSSPNGSSRNNLPRSQSHQWRTGPWGAVRHLPQSSTTSHHCNVCSVNMSQRDTGSDVNL